MATVRPRPDLRWPVLRVVRRNRCRPKVRWPNGARVAVWIIPNIEFFALDEPISTPKVPEACYVVHGEPDASAALVHRIGAELGWLAVAPRPGDRVRLD